MIYIKMFVNINNSVKILGCKSPLRITVRFKWKTAEVKLFEKLFGMSRTEFKTYRIKYPRLPELSQKEIVAYSDARKEMEIPLEEWLQYPILFKRGVYSLKQQYRYLKEGGFLHVNPAVLAYYRKCVHKKISQLKAANFIAQDTNVVERFLSYLNPQPKHLSLDDLTDDNTFENVHHTILTKYLMWRLNVSQDDISKFFRLHPLSSTKSFESLCKNILLAEKIGFSSNAMLKYGYILNVNPENTTKLLTEMSTIAGVDIRRAIKTYPKLIIIPVAQYYEVYNYLKRRNITDDTIQKSINIFVLSPETIKLRFKEIAAVPELKVLQNNPRCLELIINHNQVRSRLSFLQELQLKCATTSMLCERGNSFSEYIREGCDMNDDREIVTVMQSLLDFENKDLIKRKLKKHCYYRHIPFIEIEKSCKYLKRLGFTNENLVEVIQVLLYPVEKLNSTFNMIKQTVTPANTLTRIELLNLILYFMEKEHHFTGNGVWKQDDM